MPTLSEVKVIYVSHTMYLALYLSGSRHEPNVMGSLGEPSDDSADPVSEGASTKTRSPMGSLG